MVGVLKVDGLSNDVSTRDLKGYFRENGAKLEDVHLQSVDGETIAFLVFNDQREAHVGLQANGSIFRNERLHVRNSSPKEFNQFFPGVPMILHSSDRNGRSIDNMPSVGQFIVKIQGMETKTIPSEIRKHFKERDARPDDILIDSITGSKFHKGIAYMVFNYMIGAENALQADGSMLRNHRLTVLKTDQREFSHCFPHYVFKKPTEPRNQQPQPPQPVFVEPDRGFIGVLKVDGIPLDAKVSDLRSFLRDNDSRPSDIHLILRPDGFHDGSALAVFTEREDLENALHCRSIRNFRLQMRLSSPKEFNRFFPSVKMVSNRSKSSRRADQDKGSSYREENRGGYGTQSQRERSRSPYRNNRTDNVHNDFYEKVAEQPAPSSWNSDPLAGIDLEKYCRISGLPYDITVTQIVNYFHAVPVREINILKHTSGKYSGQTTGDAIVEFTTRNDARQAVNNFDGQFMNQRMITVRFASKQDVCSALQIPCNENLIQQKILQQVDTGNNPQMQDLLDLLTATVSAMSGGQQQALTSRRDTNRQPERNDSVISRVASSAHVDIDDIKRGCVVGLRNLPHSVTEDQIIHFFHGFHMIADSIRIHHLDDGRCSGDAIVSFRSSRDARYAVNKLNRGNQLLGGRRAELFFL